MQTARERFALALAGDARDRREAEEDVQFADGADLGQWSDKAKERRRKRREPILQWNRFPTFIAQVCNDGRQNKPSIRVSALDGAKPATAQVKQDRIRHIEYSCDADIAYDTARRHAVVSGRGFYRVGTEYLPVGDKPGPQSFNQTVTIDPIENQFSVLIDPSARKYSRKDADWMFVFSWLSKESYERAYGKDTALAASNYFGSGEANPAPDWVGVGAAHDQIQVAEYWLKTHTPRALCMLPDASSCWEDELPDDFDPAHILDTRDEDVVTVDQYIIDGVEPLAKTEFPVPLIPIVPVWGEQMVVKGDRCNYSLIRHARDPQRLVNLYVSNIAGECARMGKSMYIAAAGQLLNFEDDWEDINDDPKSAIQYNAKEVGGTQVPPPRREVYEPPIQALTLGLNQAIDAMKAAMGIYDDSLGATTNEKSGVAIQARKKQTQVSNFHFPDNEARSRKYLGQIVLALIRVLDKGPKDVPTRTEDGKTRIVRINQPTTDAKTGEPAQYDFAEGSDDIAVATGPSYTSERQEAADSYGQIAAADKNFMVWAGDLFFRTLDMPGADLIADRYEKMLPPALKPPDPNGAQAAQQNAAAVQQLQAQHGQLTDQVHNLSQALETKQAEQQARIQIAQMQEETKVTLAQLDRATKLAIAEIETKAQSAARASADAFAAQQSMMDRAHEHATGEVARRHAAGMQQAQQAHAAGMQDAAAQNAEASQQAGQEHAAGMQQSAQDAAAAAQPEPQANPQAQQ